MSLLVLLATAALVLVSVLTVVASVGTSGTSPRGVHGREELVVADGVGGLAVCEGLVHVSEGERRRGWVV